LRKWALALATASIVAAGCGGGGGKGGGSTTPPTGDGSYVKLQLVPGTVNFSFLTGAGRDIGDVTAVIKRAVLTDEFGQSETVLPPALTLQLNGFTHQILPLDVQTTSSRFFTSYTFEVQELRVDNGTTSPDVFSTGTDQPLVSVDLPASIRALPARQTAVQVYLDESMFDLSAVDPDPIFQQDLFEAKNLASNPVQGVDTLNGFLSDYVMFDLSGMSSSDRPDMTNGGKAGRVFFSGDFIALSSSSSGGYFEVLTPINAVPGTYTGIVNLPGPSGVRPPFGTYTLTQDDPRDVDPSDGTFPGTSAHQITALQGSYYQLSDAIGNLSSFEVITFPRSQERMVFDSKSGTDVLRELSQQDVVIIKRSGSTITNMYFGEIDFGADQGDPATLKAYPIGQVDDGDAHNEITGTVSGFKDKNGNTISIDSLADSQRAEAIQKICSGTFTLQSSSDPIYGGTLPGDFLSTGRFLVFRK